MTRRRAVDILRKEPVREQLRALHKEAAELALQVGTSMPLAYKELANSRPGLLNRKTIHTQAFLSNDFPISQCGFIRRAFSNIVLGTASHVNTPCMKCNAADWFQIHIIDKLAPRPDVTLEYLCELFEEYLSVDTEYFDIGYNVLIEIIGEDTKISRQDLFRFEGTNYGPTFEWHGDGVTLSIRELYDENSGPDYIYYNYLQIEADGLPAAVTNFVTTSLTPTLEVLMKLASALHQLDDWKSEYTLLVGQQMIRGGLDSVYLKQSKVDTMSRRLKNAIELARESYQIANAGIALAVMMSSLESLEPISKPCVV